MRLTLFPAGHCLGSAMLLAEDGDQSLLYTGDFKLGESATATRAELPHAEILVMECTYGHPDYRLPPRDAAIDQLLEGVRAAMASGRMPVVEAYTLGKAQEVTKLLTLAGLPVFQDRRVYDISQIYESFGVHLGCQGLWEGRRRPDPECVLVMPPGHARWDRDAPVVRFAVTGWGVDQRTKYRLGVDYAIPLSDHADYDELLEAVRRVAPQKVYCTHGPESFVDRLHEEGFDAHALGQTSQRRLF